MNLVPLNNLFSIKSGNSLDLTKMEVCTRKLISCVNYVSRTRENNGVSACVRVEPNLKPFPAGLITVAGSGDSVLSSFVQNDRFYTGYHVFVLVPKRAMCQVEKMFYCYCIKQNRYKYGFGRQANKTLKHLLVPEKVPDEFLNVNVQNLNTIIVNSLITDQRNSLISQNWKFFSFNELFKIKGTKTTSVVELEEYGPGPYPYVTTQATKNGIEGFYNYYTEEGNVLVIDSAVVGFCSYQPVPFSASDHVEKLVPKFEMNKYIGLFLATIINLEQYRYSFGRKCSQQRMRQMTIKLPADIRGYPDWQYMENFIKNLPYSSNI